MFCRNRKNTQFYWQILLHIDNNFGLQEALFKNQLALKWKEENIFPKTDAEEVLIPI